MVTDIVFSSEEINLNVDDTETIVAEVLPEDADNKTLRWSSDSPSIVSVTVDEDTHSAVVKGVSEGEAIITAAATDGSGVSAMCNVSVSAPEPEPKLVTDITLTPNELTLVDTEIGTVTADVLPIDADNKVLSWNVDSPEIILSVSEDTHSATVQGEIVDIDGIITVSATDGSGVSAICNVSIEPPPPPPPPTADYYVKSAQYYKIGKVGTSRYIRFRNTDDTEDLTLDVVDRNTVNIGKYNENASIDIYATMDFTQKSEYLIRSIEDGGYIKLVKKGSDYPELWIYRDYDVFEKINYTYGTNHIPIKLNSRYTYIGDIDNPSKYIQYTFSNDNYYVYYGSQRDSTTASYSAKVVPSTTSTNTVVTLYDPNGNVIIKRADIMNKSLELTSIKDGITTQDLYASIGAFVYCKIKVPGVEYGYIYYSNGSSEDPITYSYNTITKTHTWSPT